MPHADDMQATEFPGPVGVARLNPIYGCGAAAVFG